MIDITYEDDKTLVLAKTHVFHAVIPPKKNRKSHWLHDKQLYKQRNIIERYFLRLKRFRKVFTRYDNLILFLFSLHLLILFLTCFFMWTLPKIFFWFAKYEKIFLEIFFIGR